MDDGLTYIMMVKKMNKAMLCIGIMAVALFMPVALADEIDVTTTVSSSMSAVFSYDTVAFSTLSEGTSDNAAPNQLTGAYNVTIDTNKNFNVAAYGANFTGATSSFNINNLKMDENLAAGSLAVGDATTLSEGSQNIASNVAYTTTIDYHGFWLSIPALQFAEAYTGSVTITYSNV